MGPKQKLLALRRELAVLFLLVVGVATVMGALRTGSPLTGLYYGVIGGVPMFLVVSTLFLAVILGTPSQIRLLRGLFLGLVGIGVVGNLAAGRSLRDAIGLGFFAGGLNFLSILGLLTILFPVYLYGKHRGRTTNPQ
ncbi:hypothetical protein GRX03_06785 [Halovenus sp. WSH3]|uniref:Uncharacterized protein n=1 Tax=Halovenus carboxidivorans TaxID=2692199 RepID=A0A6B0T8W7_9EURY|nr:hypothetical protein [Halovenus carboxidivorans]MXR51310.1 hypothetical protein [Halovenus carboxidivorans]